MKADDPVNSPRHYCLESGAELIEFIEALPYCRGAAIKYLFRAGKKHPDKELEDLRKAAWMVNREIDRVSGGLGAKKNDFILFEENMP